MNTMTFPFQGEVHERISARALSDVRHPLPEQALKMALVFALHAGVVTLALHLPAIPTADFIHAHADVRPIEVSLLRARLSEKPLQHVEQAHAGPAKPLPKHAQAVVQQTQAVAARSSLAIPPRADPVAAPLSSVPNAPAKSDASSSATPAAAAAAAPLIAAHVDANYSQNTAPVYPPMSRRLHEEGKVQLLVKVSAKGDVDAIAIKQSSGYSRLDEVALNTVRAWRFVPARRGDEAVADSVVVPIQFKLND